MPGRTEWLIASQMSAIRRKTRKTPASAPETAARAAIAWTSSWAWVIPPPPAAFRLGATGVCERPAVRAEVVHQSAPPQCFQRVVESAPVWPHGPQHADG